MGDADELSRGTNPLIPDSGTGGTGFAGRYVGQDILGSGLAFDVLSNGAVYGVFRIVQFGFYVDVPLAGQVDGAGNIAFLSPDFFFSFRGRISGGSRSGSRSSGGASSTTDVSVGGRSSTSSLDMACSDPGAGTRPRVVDSARRHVAGSM